MSKAVIEMGTNSSRLLIAELKENQIKELKKDLITTRLGEGVDQNQVLNDKAIKRGLEALYGFREEIEACDVSSVKVVGTSALRDVKNGAKFQKMVKEEAGYDLEIISGHREAELILRGVTYGYDFPDYIIIDIGGGSTEFIWKNEDVEKVQLDSLNLGAVRLTERFIDQPELALSRNVIEDIAEYVGDKLKREIGVLPGVKNLIGVGGTITTLAAMLQKLEEYDSQAIHDYIIKYPDINKILDRLRKLDLEKRKKVKGLNPQRADIIITGIIILNEIMKTMRTLKLRVSDYDILHGLIIES